MGTIIGLILCLMTSFSAAKLPDDIFELPLDGKARHKVFWALDYKNSEVKFEIHAHLNESEWFAFGFSDRGDLENGDYCVYQPRRGMRSTILGVWTDDKCIANAFEEEDDICGSFNYMQNDILKFTFTRPFQQCAPHHYQIEDGTTHIVWSRGSGPIVGRRICNRAEQGMTRVQILKTQGIAAPQPPSTWTFAPTVKDVKVPSLDTTYWCKTIQLPKQLKQKHHIIQVESHISKGNEGLVHHMELFHCEVPKGTIVPEYSGICTEKPDELKVCSKVITAWAMGAKPFIYPKEAGLPIGGPDYSLYAVVEVHYNNPSMSPDWVDSSGFKIYLTSDLRPNDAGIIELGLEYVDKMAIPPKQKMFQLTGYCISECTNSALPENGIMVFGSQLHTHLTGTMIETRHIRNGVELPRINYDYHYSPHFQEIRLLKHEIQVLPGDALVTTCYYDTMTRTNITLGGFATTDEMCVDYIYYYPKVDLEVCKSSISDDALADYFDSNAKLENQATGSDFPISDAYKGIEWNPIRVEILQALYENAPISMQCNNSAGQRFPGDWSHMPLSVAVQPRSRDANSCFDDVDVRNDVSNGNHKFHRAKDSSTPKMM